MIYKKRLMCNLLQNSSHKYVQWKKFSQLNVKLRFKICVQTSVLVKFLSKREDENVVIRFVLETLGLS